MGGKKVGAPMIAPHVERVVTGVALVPASDPRPAALITDPASVFLADSVD